MTIPITGERQLSDDEVALINEINDLGRVIEHVIDDVTLAQGDPRWAAIATTGFQQSLMDLRRAVAKPEGF